MYSGSFCSRKVRRSLAEGAVTYHGDAQLNDPDRAILNVTRSRADPCLFEAFYIEGFGSTASDPIAMSYVGSIDLRRPSEASIKEVQPSAAGGSAVLPRQAEPVKTLILRSPKLVCYRAVTFDPARRVSFTERCDDEITSTEQERMPRMTRAMEVLRNACHW